MTMKTSTLLATLGIALTAGITQAQIVYGTAGSTYTQDFSSGLPADADNFTWTDNSVFTGVYAYQSATSAAPAEYRKTSDGDSSQANLFQWRPSAGSSDGALGTKPQTATGDMATGFRFSNTTGITLTQFSLGYVGEQWYSSSSVQNNQLVVSYQLGSPANLLAGSWTEIPALEFNSIFNDGTVRNLDGSLPANQIVFSPVTVSGLNWASGTDLYIRWFDANSSGTRSRSRHRRRDLHSRPRALDLRTHDRSRNRAYRLPPPRSQSLV